MTDAPKTKILVELEVEVVSEHNDGKHFVAKFSHPDLQGHLYLRSSSEGMMKVQLQHLDTNKQVLTDPISQVLNSVTKLSEGVKDLRELVGKKEKK